MTNRSAILLSLLILALCLLGCSDGKIARYPVKGTILVDGRPAAGAIVIFCPIEGEPEFMRERPFCRTDEQGSFELRTFEPGDGAPAGDYKVTITWSGTPGSSSFSGGDRLRDRYATPEKSELTATVKAEPNDLPPFELKTK